jgi:hypothetical protein
MEMKEKKYVEVPEFQTGNSLNFCGCFFPVKGPIKSESDAYHKNEFFCHQNDL